MGMYTEVFFRGEIEPEGNGRLISWLGAVIDGEDVPPFEDHPFFECDRWRSVFVCSSAYFPTRGSLLAIRHWGASREYDLYIHSSLKNYDGEIGKFFDWISNYLMDTSDQDPEFIGYSLYEEDARPTLHFH